MGNLSSKEGSRWYFVNDRLNYQLHRCAGNSFLWLALPTLTLLPIVLIELNSQKKEGRINIKIIQFTGSWLYPSIPSRLWIKYLQAEPSMRRLCLQLRHTAFFSFLILLILLATYLYLSSILQKLYTQFCNAVPVQDMKVCKIQCAIH